MGIMKRQNLNILLLLLSVHIVTSSAFGTEEPSSLEQIPYTIDTDEVEGATTMWADLLGSRTELQGKSAGTYALPHPLSADNPVVIVSISKPKVGMVGRDVLIWCRKEKLDFSASNNARAAVISGLIDFRIPKGQLMKAYGKISNHPRFAELRQMMLKERGYPNSDAFLDSTAEVTFEIANDVLKEPELE